MRAELSCGWAAPASGESRLSGAGIASEIEEPSRRPNRTAAITRTDAGAVVVLEWEVTCATEERVELPRRGVGRSTVVDYLPRPVGLLLPNG